MNKNHQGTVRAMGALAAAGLIGVALAGAGVRLDLPPLPTGAITTETEAFVALPSEVVVAGGTRQVTPSPEGDYVLIGRAVAPPPKSPFPDDAPPKWAELSLVLWNASSRRTTILWRKTLTDISDQPPIGFDAPESGEIEWLPQSGVAFLRFATVAPEGKSINRRLMVMDAARGTLRGGPDMGDADEFYVSHDRPLAVVMRRDKGGFQVIGANGVPGRLVTPSDPTATLFGWMPGGKGLYGLRPRPPADAPEAERKKSRWVVADIQTGAVSSLDKRPPVADAEPMPLPPLAINAGTASLKEGETTAAVSPLWLEGADKKAVGRVLLAPDGEQPLLLPKAALYQRHGVLFAVPLIRMDKATYAQLQTEILRRQTLSNAKQIGLALMMYCQDYDENFPPPGDGKDIAEVANPYLKNISVFNDISTGKFGFIPAYKSTALTAYDTPATTPLGYLTGPGGRVIIYADGHVAWE